MVYEITVVLIILEAAILLFISDKLRPDVISVLILAALGITGILKPNDLYAGFGHSAIITIGATFVLSAGLTRTGVILKIGSILTEMATGKQWRTRLIILGIIAFLSAFINNTPVVVVFIPAILAVCRNLQLSPSKLLIPVSYASMLGGSCTLVGTSTNILIASLWIDHFADRPAISMYEFAWVGVPMVLVGMVYLMFFSEKILPNRATVSFAAPPEAKRSYVTELTIPPGSPLIGKMLSETILGPVSVRPIELIRGETIHHLDEQTILREGDALLIRGELDQILDLNKQEGVRVVPELAPEHDKHGQIEMTLAELMIPPDSQIIGRTCREIHLRSRFGVTAFAIQRNGQHFRNKIADLELQFGDVLLVRATPKDIEDLRQREAFIVLEGIRRNVILRNRAPLAVGTIVGVVLLASLNLVPISIAAMAGVAFLILTKVISPRQAYYSVDWSILVLLAGTISLGRAMEDTGAGSFLAEAALAPFMHLHPWFILSGVFLTAMTLTSFISNAATAALLTPLSITVALALGVDPKPFVMAVAFGSSSAFATPMGYQTNLMVQGPGGYFFKDYVKFGVPLNLLIWLTACLLIPLVWPL